MNKASELLNLKDPAAEIERIIFQGQKFFTEAKIHQVVIGVSGGLDSAVVLTLLTKMLPKTDIYAFLMPSSETSEQSCRLARELVASLDIPADNVLEVDLSESVSKILEKRPAVQKETDQSTLKRTRGNIMARLRMIYLFDWAALNWTLVAGTENRSERELGYYTMYGDSASSFELISHLYKTQVRQLARELGVSPEIIEREPSADLWEGQTDEGEMGFSYEEADLVLAADNEHEPNYLTGIDQKIIEQVRQRRQANRYKLFQPQRIENN